MSKEKVLPAALALAVSIAWASSAFGQTTLTESASYPATCTNALTCNQPASVTDARNVSTDYTYDAVHGGLLTKMQPAPVPGAPRPLAVYAYQQRYAYVKGPAGTLQQAASPVWVPVSETLCQTAAGSSAPVCDSATPSMITTYEYGANGTANNLFLKGKVVTADGISLRTCYGHDDFGNVLFVTTPGAGQGACQ